jgi:hypothetical protein
MAKKKNKSQTVGESSDGTIHPSPSPGSAASTASTPKPKDAKPPQPSTSALIICRNKYVPHRIHPDPAIGFLACSLWPSAAASRGSRPELLTATDAEAFSIAVKQRLHSAMRLSGYSMLIFFTDIGAISLLSMAHGSSCLPKSSKVSQTITTTSLVLDRSTLPSSSIS